jgi:hypothetical protein
MGPSVLRSVTNDVGLHDAHAHRWTISWSRLELIARLAWPRSLKTPRTGCLKLHSPNSQVQKEIVRWLRAPRQSSMLQCKFRQHLWLRCSGRFSQRPKLPSPICSRGGAQAGGGCQGASHKCRQAAPCSGCKAAGEELQKKLQKLQQMSCEQVLDMSEE